MLSATARRFRYRPIHGHGLHARWEPEPRCTRCGHRVMRHGVKPVPTRMLPVILWPFELAARAEARLRGRLGVR